MSPAGDRWAVGDRHALAFPADPPTLRRGGPQFLTDALRASGALRDNRIARITRFRELNAGSTGRKVMLSVDHAVPEPGLPDDLFVKFSRDFDDPIRDRGKTQMESEVRFAALSRAAGFPIAVPAVQFADYDRGTGTGILITQRIAFGLNGIERQYHKCLDYELPEPVEHYRALLTALARLAGTHRAGRLPADLVAQFPVDVRGATVGERPPLSADALNRRLGLLVDFIQTHSGLVPATAGAPEFLARLRADVPRVAEHEGTLMLGRASDSDYVALCHWNANIDNAWFWRDGGGMHCGLMDWGCVGQMNLGMGIWGALSGAETWLWESHLDELLEVFVTEFARCCGGPQLEPEVLRRHTLLYAAAMGVAWLLDVPALIRRRFDVAPSSRMDPRVRDDEGVRAPLQMLSNLLSLWQRHGIGDLLDTGS